MPGIPGIFFARRVWCATVPPPRRSAVRFSYSAIQLFSYSAIQLFSYSAIAYHPPQEDLELRNFIRRKVAQVMVERIDRNQRHLVGQALALVRQAYLHHAPVGMAAQAP